MNLRKLDERETEAGLETVSGSSLKQGKLFQEFAFPRFIEAFGFMASVATVTGAGVQFLKFLKLFAATHFVWC